MGDELTLDKARAAVNFGPRFCGPVATLIQKHHNSLPAEDVLILTTEFHLSMAYLEPNSELLKYYYHSLIKFRTLLLDKVPLDYFRKYYDPTIEFFKTQLNRGSAVRMNCYEKPSEMAAPPSMQPLPKNEISKPAIKTYLQKRYDFNIDGDLESWLGHRLIYSRVTGSKDLVIVIVETHNNAIILEDQMKLHDRFLSKADRVDVNVAYELTPEEADPFYRISNSGGMQNILKEIYGQAPTAQRMFQYLRKPSLVPTLCEQISKADPRLSFEGCLHDDKILLFKFFTLSFFYGRNPNYYWALDRADLKRRSLVLMYKNDDLFLPSKERFSLIQELDGLGRVRSKVMTENLLKRLKNEKAKKSSRVVIFPVGATHTLDVIRYLQSNSNISILGLMSNNFAGVIDPIAKLPD